MARLASDEARLVTACKLALREFDAASIAGHVTASNPQVVQGVWGTDAPALFALCNECAILLARVYLPDAARQRRGLLRANKMSDLAELQKLFDRLLADGFVAGLAIASLRAEPLAVDATTPIYPSLATRWYVENATDLIYDELDQDPVACDMLNTVARGEIAVFARRVDEAQASRRRDSDPSLTTAYAEQIARTGYALRWVHTKHVQEHYGEQHTAWVARETLRLSQ